MPASYVAAVVPVNWGFFSFRDWGSRGRWFESSRPDHDKTPARDIKTSSRFFLYRGIATKQRHQIATKSLKFSKSYEWNLAQKSPRLLDGGMAGFI